MAKATEKNTTSGPAVEPAKAAEAPPGIVAPEAATPGSGGDLSRLLAAMPPAVLQPGPELDRFGLPTSWTVLTDDTAVREAAVADRVRELFAAAVRHLGEREARELFHEASKGKRARPRKVHLSASDRELLAIYDARVPGLTPHQVRALPRQIATERATHMRPAGATEKHLRRLLNHRDEQQAEAAALVAALRRLGVTSILGSL